MPAKAAVRPVVVVFELPVPDQHMSLEQGVELLGRPQLVAQARAEGLPERVLPRRARLDIARPRAREATLVSRGYDRTRAELGEPRVYRRERLRRRPR